MLKNLKYYVVVSLVLIIGAFLLHNLLTKYNKLEEQKKEEQLNRAHFDAMISAKARIEVYATLVSSLRSFTKNTSSFPSEKQLQNYLKDLLKEIQFNDSIVVNYIDTNHVFKYIITPSQIDAPKLKGVSVRNFRPQSRIDELNRLMRTNEIKLFTPINLREGWAGFPFNFSARNNKNETLGYVTPILNVKYLLDYFYENNNQDTYVHKFLVNDSIDLTREAYYNGSSVFNKIKDPEYYKNFNASDDDFIYSPIELFGLSLKIGSAYKIKPTINKNINKIAYLWYSIIGLLVFITLFQYLKNSRLNKSLQVANNQVISKNKALEKNLFKIQTLIKEIHHRVKNNILVISNLLFLQEREYDDKNIKTALQESRNRIKSMSLVHEKLYNSATLKDIKIHEYITQLISSVEDIVRDKTLQLQKEINVDEALIFDADTTANLGLILNEFLTNSFKYSFKENEGNLLQIDLNKDQDYYRLSYKDNGPGLPNDFDIKTSKSLGMQLIQILSEQLGGTFTYHKYPENIFEVYFKPVPIHESDSLENA